MSCLFAMQGAEGGEYIASNKDGKLTILDDNDPIFGSIMHRVPFPTTDSSAGGSWHKCSI